MPAADTLAPTPVRITRALIRIDQHVHAEQYARSYTAARFSYFVPAPISGMSTGAPALLGPCLCSPRR